MAAPDLSKLSIDRSAVAPRARRRWGWWLLALLLLAAAGALGLSGRLAGPASVDTVSVSTAYPSQGFTLLNATGYAVAQRKASVASKATGRLEWLGVMEGSRVKKDEVIARLESRDVTAQRDQAAASVKVAEANIEQGQAELRDAESAFRRSQDLVGKKYISESAHDAAVARYDKARASIKSLQASLAVARANLRTAEVALDQTLIRAPFDGVVLTKNANVGDNITPFSSAIDTKGAVVTMADMDTLEVEADVSESSLSRIKIGQPTEIQLDAIPGERFAGTVNRIVPTVDRAKATVLVKVKFNERDPRVLPDMSAKVAFLEREPKPDERRPITVVPAGAVIEAGGGKAVFVVRDGIARRVAVSTGMTIGDAVEVRGVSVGDRVIARPGDAALDGRRVKIGEK